MRLKPKAHVHLRMPAGRPEARAYLADEAARRRRQTPPRVETDLIAELIARGRRKESDPR